MDTAGERPDSADDRLLFAGVAAALLLLVASLVRRIGLGVDVQDESFYVATAYRFAIGDRPFVDEVFIHQTAALLTAPIAHAHLALVGSTDGIIVGMRAAYLAFSLGVAATAAFVLSHLVRTPHALLVGAACAAFVPFGIPNLSYNTLGFGFLTCGTLLGALAAFHDRARGGLVPPIAGGLLLGLGVFTYPPLALVAPVQVLAVFFATRGRAPRAAWAHLLASVAAGIAGAAALLSFGWENVAASIEATNVIANKGGGERKLAFLANDILRWVVRQPAALLLAGLLAGLARSRWRRAVPLLAIGVPLALASVGGVDPVVRGHLQVFQLALALPLLVRAANLDTDERRFCLLASVGCLVAAPLVSYTSTNGLVNAGITCVPAMLAALAATVATVERANVSGPRALANALPAVPAVLFLLVLQASYATSVYPMGSPPTREQTALVEDGPFAGIRTTERRARVIDALQGDLDRFVDANDGILFFDALPAGYLMTPARPVADTTWTALYRLAEAAPTNLLAYYERVGRRPDVVVRRRVANEPPGHPLVSWVQAEYDLVVDHAGHQLYRARKR